MLISARTLFVLKLSGSVIKDGFLIWCLQMYVLTWYGEFEQRYLFSHKKSTKNQQTNEQKITEHLPKINQKWTS